MLRKNLTFAVAALLAFTAAAAADEMTLDEVLAMNLEARGGAEKIADMDTARITGTMTVGPGMDAPFTIEWKRPGKVRVEFTFQGQQGIQAYDGETGWLLMPFMGQTEPEQMSTEDTRQLAEQADFEGPLVNYEDKGNEVEYLGSEDIEGTPAHKLKVTRPSGDSSYLYLDAEYGLEIKEQGKRTTRGQEVEYETTYGDYKEVDGRMFPFSQEVSVAGAPEAQVMTFDTIELNVDIPDSRFEMPATEAPETEMSEGEGAGG